jgi:transposase
MKSLIFFEVSPSTVIKWLQRWRDIGSALAKPSGGSVSPLEKRAGWLLALIAEHPDLTLEEVVTAMRKRRIVGSSSTLSRFVCAPRSRLHPTSHARQNAAFESKACLALRG